MLVNIVQRRQFYGIPFTLISGLYNYYQLSDVLSVVRFVVNTMDVISKNFIDNLKI